MGLRLIDADALKNMCFSSGMHDDNCIIYVPMHEVMRYIDTAPTVGGWISVKDKLPETNDEVLTTYLYDDKPNIRYVESASYFDDGEGEGHWHSVWDEFSIGRIRKTTIAWMPMPKPYKPPKENE